MTVVIQINTKISNDLLLPEKKVVDHLLSYEQNMLNFRYPTTVTKKRSGETQTLRAGCSKAEPKMSPPADPLPGGAGQPKFNQLKMVTTFT